MRYRMINCDFIASLTKVSNRATLLYVNFITEADDMGFVGNAETIIERLQIKADNEGDIGLGLEKTDFKSALDELITKGLVYEIKLTSGNLIYLIKHWWYHNRWKNGLYTNFTKAYRMFEIEDGEYHLKKEQSKESSTKKVNGERTTKQIKSKQNKTKQKLRERESAYAQEDNGYEVVTEEDIETTVQIAKDLFSPKNHH